MTGECELCGNQNELLNSHIIPSFVIRWQKKSSATGFLRTAEDPETRFQDYTEELLCEDCETELNNYETPFATYHFHPYVNGTSGPFEYDEWLKKFITSVSWRLIASTESSYEDLQDYEKTPIMEAREIWGDILRGDLPLSSDPFTHHILFLDNLELKSDPDQLPDKWEFYSNRTIDATVSRGVGTHYYFKFPHFAFISCIQPPRIPGFYNTEVGQTGSITTSQSIPRDWESFLLNRCRIFTNHDLSEREREKIKEKMLGDPERVIESDSFQAFQEEMERKVSNHDPTEYLGQDCPVCFTNHEVIDFLPERPLQKSEVESLKEKMIFAKAIYMKGELSHPEAPENIAPTIVLSKLDKAVVASLYSGVGWVVENEVEYHQEDDPTEVCEIIWEETLKAYEDWVKEVD